MCLPRPIRQKPGPDSGDLCSECVCLCMQGVCHFHAFIFLGVCMYGIACIHVCDAGVCAPAQCLGGCRVY